MRWRERLHRRLAGQPTPMLIQPDAIWSAASLWAGARQWVRHFRTSGVQPGERVVCALPADASFVQCLIAALWEGVTLAVTTPASVEQDGIDGLLTQFDAYLVCTSAKLRQGTEGGYAELRAGPAGWPVGGLRHLRWREGEPTPDARLLLRTSGSGGAAQWVALSDENLFAVLDSHAPYLALDGACVLSVLPWHHAFGLILGLLPALLAADEIVRDPDGGRDLDALCDLAAEHPITHVDLVPLLATKLLADVRGRELLRGVRGGVVGGAPVSAALANMLGETRLRVGYGQTEASPGITLGEPGEWTERYLGRAIGCEVRIEPDGVLAYRGPNACLGYWEHGALRREPADRWMRSGDIADALPDGAFRYVGRAGDAFKLPNGRFVDAPRWEDELRRAVPALAELVLRAHGTDGLELLWSVRPVRASAESSGSPSDVSADDAALQGAIVMLLAPLGVPVVTRQVAPDGWRRTAKGEINRRVPLSD